MVALNRMRIKIFVIYKFLILVGIKDTLELD